MYRIPVLVCLSALIVLVFSAGDIYAGNPEKNGNGIKQKSGYGDSLAKLMNTAYKKKDGAEVKKVATKKKSKSALKKTHAKKPKSTIRSSKTKKTTTGVKTLPKIAKRSPKK
jgi:hypothetical protein